MYDWNGDWESYEYTVKDMDVYNNDANDANYENYEHDESDENNEHDESNEHDENNEHDKHNEHDESNEHAKYNESNENDRKKIIEEITKEIIGSYVNYLIHDGNKSDSTDHEDCLESDSEDEDDEEDDEEENDEDVKSLDSDEDVKNLGSDEDGNDSEGEVDEDMSRCVEVTNDSDDDSDGFICKGILLNCCTLYIIMLSIYVNTILCTYIALRC